jgi:hypothetical protein
LRENKFRCPIPQKYFMVGCVTVTVADMLGKVPKLRYAYHDMHDAAKLSYLAEETYLINTGKIAPLGKPIMEPLQ